ncbi:uncharacterized protein Neto1-dt [Peromyscus maniculatus bairdii]|uniref:uncharacterized protein Neto1-dt n=1 Tax=Peromyscus maniculatus bairdii TaxID=230844 RepID=UPI003FD2A2CE
MGRRRQQGHHSGLRWAVPPPPDSTAPPSTSAQKLRDHTLTPRPLLTPACADHRGASWTSAVQPQRSGRPARGAMSLEKEKQCSWMLLIRSAEI